MMPLHEGREPYANAVRTPIVGEARLGEHHNQHQLSEAHQSSAGGEEERDHQRLVLTYQMHLAGHLHPQATAQRPSLPTIARHLLPGKDHLGRQKPSPQPPDLHRKEAFLPQVAGQVIRRQSHPSMGVGHHGGFQSLLFRVEIEKQPSRLLQQAFAQKGIGLANAEAVHVLDVEGPPAPIHHPLGEIHGSLFVVTI